MTTTVRIGGIDTAIFDNAPCLGLSSLFYAKDYIRQTKAKAICKTCPHIEACLDHAVANREPEGVWGGQYILRGNIVLQHNGGVGRSIQVVPDLPVPQKYSHLVRINIR